MAIKLKEFLQSTFERVDIRGDEIAAVLGASALAEIELPETAVEKFNKSYLTRERAENDAEIVKKIKAAGKAEGLNSVDEKIKAFLPVIPKEKADLIEREQNSFKKLELLSEAVSEAINNTKSSKDQDVRKVEEEWANKVKQIETQYSEKLALKDKEMREASLNFVLKNKILGFDFADSFKGIKETLAETIISKVKSHTVDGKPVILELDQSGNLNVRHDVEGTLRDVYLDGNEKLTITNLLEKEVEPFTKKSNGTETPNGNTQTTKAVTKPVDPSKVTLREMRFAG